MRPRMHASICVCVCVCLQVPDPAEALSGSDCRCCSECPPRSSSSHLKLMQMFLTWQRWLWRFSSVSRALEYQVWHSDHDYEYLTAQRGSGEVQWSRARWGQERSGSAGPMWVLTAVQHRKHPDGWYRQIPAAKLRSSGCAVPWARSVTHDSARADDDDDADAARRINTHSQQPNCSGAFTCLLTGLMMTACVCLKRSLMCMHMLRLFIWFGS